MPRRVRIDLAYDGTSYDGWQIQPGRPTVQGGLEAVLTRLHGGTPVRVHGAGRTDAGVHARGQVADALLSDRMPADAPLERALRSLLPADVRVLSVRTVADGFHARHDAIRKTYAYLIDRSAWGDPFLARFVLHEPRRLDLDAVDAALATLPGKRDWTGFTAASCTIEDKVRTLHEARRHTVRPGLDALVFSADGFLTHMVRNIVGTLLDVGRGRFAPDQIARIVESKDRALAGATAPARGLTLDHVAYPGEAPRALW
jgi:tRNA pseudouridine38-40 synthase